MEEILKQILEGQQQLFAGQKQLFEGQKQLFAGQQQLFDGQNQLVAEVTSINQRLNSLESNVSAITSDMSAVKEDTSEIRTQQHENSEFIQALLHRTEELDAKLDGLAINTASKEAVADLDAKFEVLNARLFHQEAELYKLKAIK